MNPTRILILAALSALGCGAPEAPLSSSTSALVVENGRQLNGRQLNGRQLNGRQLNGRQLNGRQLNGRELNGAHLDGASRDGASATVQLEGSELVVSTPKGATLRGAQVVGTVLVGDDAVSEVPLRIDAATQDAAQPDLWRYSVSFATREGWEPLCVEEESGDAQQAIALSGRWDYRSGVAGGGAHLDDPRAITFACEERALAKCVEFGYAPWRTTLRCDGSGCTRISLAAHHQACTRMLRADFCGNGRSYTQDGTLINLYDGAGIQQDTEAWAFEAEWDENGARCLSTRRLTESPTVPGCKRDLDLPSCGSPSHFDTGTLTMTEYAPTAVGHGAQGKRHD